MSGIQFSAVRNLMLPKASEQMRWAYMTYDTSLGATTENLKYQQLQGEALVPQSIIVNTMQVSDSTDIVWDAGGLNFPLTIPPNVIQLFTVPALEPLRFSILPTAGSTGLIRIDMLNFPGIPENFQPVDALSGKNVTVANGATNPVVAALYQAGAVLSEANPIFAALSLAGAAISPTNPVPTIAEPNTATTLVFGTATAAGSTALPAPPAGTSIRKLRLTFSENATLAAAGIENVQITLNGAVIFEDDLYLPATALTNNTVAYKADIEFDEIAFVEGAFDVVLGTALATGQVSVAGWFA